MSVNNDEVNHDALLPYDICTLSSSVGVQRSGRVHSEHDGC